MSDQQNQPALPVATRLHPRNNAGAIQVIINGKQVSACRGETVAVALLLSGRRIFTQASRYNLNRTLFCGMGVCHQCLVTVDGVRDVRACMTKIRPGMKIETRFKMEHSYETS